MAYEQEENIQIPPKFTIRIVSDCLSIVNRLNRHRHDILNKDMGCDEIDVELQTLLEINKLIMAGFEVQISHVIAHSNNKKNKNKPVSIESSLNTIADCLAKAALDLPIYEIIPITFQACEAHLWQNNLLITNNIKQHIRDSFFFPKVENWLALKNPHWEPNQMKGIWWNAFNTTIKTFPPIDIMRIQKYVNNMLPTNHSESKFRPHIEDRCLSCFEINEDLDHILKCSCHKRNNIRKDFLHDLSIKIKYRTPEIEPLIMIALSAWFKSEPIPNPQLFDKKFTNLEINAYIAQTKIGWDNFLKGRLSTEWEFALGMDDRLMIKKWAWTIISSNWNFFLNTWNQRNKDIYGEESDQQESDLQDLIKQAIYIASKNLPTAHYEKHFITINEEEIRQMNSNTLRAWIYNAKTISAAHQRQTTSEQIKDSNSKPARARLKN